MRGQVSDCSLGVELRVEYARCHRLDSEIVKNFSNVEVIGLKCREHFAVGRNDRGARAEISPDERDRDIADRKFRLALIQLDLANLQRFAFGLGDCLKIHVVAGKKNDWHIEPIRRIRRVDIGPERLQIAVTSFLENELQLSRIFECLRVATPFPVE